MLFFVNILQVAQVLKTHPKQSINKFKVLLSVMHFLDITSESILENCCPNMFIDLYLEQLLLAQIYYLCVFM